jgi:hypothetical protein
MAIKSRSIDHLSRAWVDFFRLPFVIEKMHKIEKEIRYGICRTRMVRTEYVQKPMAKIRRVKNSHTFYTP